MAEVRAHPGVPVAAQFAGYGAVTPCAPVVIDNVTGFAYSMTAAGAVVAFGSGGTVTSVAETFTGGLISVAGSPITTTGTLALTVAGTSGGIPYFSSGTTWASSAALAANQIVLGGGAGTTPATLGSTGSTGQVLRAGAGAPTWSTATYPATATSAGTILRSDGTNWAVSQTTYPDLVSSGNVLIATAGNTVGSVGTTGTAGTNVVLATSPTLVTPTLGVASATSINFGGTALSVYTENTWTPTFSGLTVVNGTGGATYSGSYTKIGRLVIAKWEITVTGTCTTASTANSTNISNLPFTSSTAGNCMIVNDSIVSYGIGKVLNSSTACYLPTWAAYNGAITGTCIYQA